MAVIEQDETKKEADDMITSVVADDDKRSIRNCCTHTCSHSHASYFRKEKLTVRTHDDPLNKKKQNKVKD